MASNTRAIYGGVVNPDTDQYQKLYQQLNSGDTAAVEQFLSDRGFGELVGANPYNNLNYRQTSWQKLLSSWGIRTKYDSAMEQANLQSREYLSSLLQQQYQNEFNDPASQAARMRKAGMNPDLLGTEGVSDSATPPADNSVMSPETFAGDAESVGKVFEITNGIASFVGNVFTQGIQMAQGLANIKATNVGTWDSYINAAIQILSQGDTVDLQPNNLSGQGFDENGNPIKGAKKEVPKGYEMIIRGLPGTNRQRNQLLGITKELKNRLGHVRASMNERKGLGDDILEAAQNSYSEYKSWRGFNSGSYEKIVEEFGNFQDYCTEKAIEFSKKMSDYRIKAFGYMNTQLEADEVGAANELVYNQSFNVGNAVDAANSQNLMAKQTANSLMANDIPNLSAHLQKTQIELQQAMQEFQRDLHQKSLSLLKDLEDRGKKGDFLAKILNGLLVGNNFIGQTNILGNLGQIVGMTSGVGKAMNAFKSLSGSRMPDFNANFEVDPLPQWNF